MMLANETGILANPTIEYSSQVAKPLSDLQKVGWGGRDRTSAWRNQNPSNYCAGSNVWNGQELANCQTSVNGLDAVWLMESNEIGRHGLRKSDSRPAGRRLKLDSAGTVASLDTAHGGSPWNDGERFTAPVRENRATRLQHRGPARIATSPGFSRNSARFGAAGRVDATSELLAMPKPEGV